MGMFFVAPASSFHDNNPHHHTSEPIISSDPHNVHNSSSTSLGVGLGVFPLLTTSPCVPAASRAAAAAGGYQFWQSDDQHEKASILDDNNGYNVNAVKVMQCSGGATATTCQDCGNQAKKDCSHKRCRSCCKSRNFDCPTHVKSTWVPAARRRERMAAEAVVTTSGSSSAIKKARVIPSQNTATSHTSTSNNTPPRSFDSSSGHQDASFKEGLPEQVRVPAVFKCVRMTALEGGEDEYAYQATMKINGHVFKGLLYNQGVESNDGCPDISELHLSGATSGRGRGGGGRNVGVSAAPLIAPFDVYGTSGGGILGGSNYGHPID